MSRAGTHIDPTAPHRPHGPTLTPRPHSQESSAARCVLRRAGGLGGGVVFRIQVLLECVGQRYGVIPGHLRDQNLGLLWGVLGSTRGSNVGSFWGALGDAVGLFWDPHGTTLGSCRGISGGAVGLLHPEHVGLDQERLRVLLGSVRRRTGAGRLGWRFRVSPGPPRPGSARVPRDASGGSSAGTSRGTAAGRRSSRDARSAAYRAAPGPSRAAHEANVGSFWGTSPRFGAASPGYPRGRPRVPPGRSGRAAPPRIRAPPAALPPRRPPSGPPPAPPPASSAAALPAEPLGGAGRGRSSPE